MEYVLVECKINMVVKCLISNVNLMNCNIEDGLENWCVKFFF